MSEQHWTNKTIAICAIVAVVVGIVINLLFLLLVYIPQLDREDARFSLNQTSIILDRAQKYVKENSGTIGQDTAITLAGNEFRSGWEFYDDEQYHDALDRFKEARRIIRDAFPPEQIPSIYDPFAAYPEPSL